MTHGRLRACGASLVVVVVALVQGSSVRAAAGLMERPSIEIAVHPVADKPNQYECKATVSDLATGQVVATPRVRSVRGETATIKQGFVGSGGVLQVVEVILLVSTDGRSATYETRILQGQVTLQRQRVTFNLTS